MSSPASSDQPRFVHWCEACGREEVMTSTEAYAAGWDAPPTMGTFGVLSPRTCPACPLSATLWWRVVVDRFDSADFSDADRAVLARIAGEPESMLPTGNHDNDGGAAWGSGVR